MAKPNMHCFTGEREEMLYLYEPYGFNEGMARGNLGYQMQYSVESLERQLADEGAPHVLQLNMVSHDSDWKNPDTWHLYADGYEVASGDGLFARQCFSRSAEAFRDACRDAVEGSELPKLEQQEYRLLKRAQRIARFEPFDRGEHVMGKPEGRAC